MERTTACPQFEQNAGCGDSAGADGVRGKGTDAAALRDKLTGALIGLARAAEGNTHPTETTYRLLIRGLFATDAGAGFAEAAIRALIDEVHGEKRRLVPGCSACASPCGRNDDYDMARLRDADEDVRSLKLRILLGIRETAARACRAGFLGCSDDTFNRLFAGALFAVGEDRDAAELLPIVREVGEVRLQCMEQKTIPG